MNKIIVDGQEATLQIKHLKAIFSISIDPEDAEKIASRKWRFLTSSYAVVSGQGKDLIFLHRFLLDLPRNTMVKFANNDPSDYRKSNLIARKHFQTLASETAKIQRMAKLRVATN